MLKQRSKCARQQKKKRRGGGEGGRGWKRNSGWRSNGVCAVSPTPPPPPPLAPWPVHAPCTPVPVSRTPGQPGRRTPVFCFPPHLDLPPDLPVWIDSAVVAKPWVVVGAGSRSAKIKLDPAQLTAIDGYEVVEGLATAFPAD